MMWDDAQKLQSDALRSELKRALSFIYDDVERSQAASREIDALFASAAKAAKLEANVYGILRHSGESARCKADNCRAPIFWVRHSNGKPCPYDPDGTPHFATCPNAKRFRKEGQR